MGEKQQGFGEIVFPSSVSSRGLVGWIDFTWDKVKKDFEVCII